MLIANITIQIVAFSERIIVPIQDLRKQNILKSFTDLASDTKFVLPAITFTDYCYDKNKKLKRVESFKN